ncbi:MAG: hypothetical protein E7L36_07505 [Prevotella bivia]|uniref:Uncharacterized protein n=1 Tax=Prevotella bivia TaxID=28125 RepID=A0A137SW98_9BACT|nr:hypothetical protein [Prevotella bivia]KXO16725.1 hypothetical protein HMPREF3202_01336 [Prevotella bivia]KXU56289.1 hypothetical protein HMPREF3218_0202119 [Prevotella bivia]MDU7315518.1 hypothetical protein [Prevotella bivia]MDZ3817658.1 hypothetical protein [Prevotella bivia]
MKTKDNAKAATNTAYHRSYFDWGSDMQIIRKGNGDIAMTEGELVRFFGVTWRKLNHRLQTIIKTSDLHPDERVAGEEEVIINGQLKGYAPLYQLSAIIALSFLLDSMEAHLFRGYVCQRLKQPASMITPIFLLGNKNN